MAECEELWCGLLCWHSNRIHQQERFSHRFCHSLENVNFYFSLNECYSHSTELELKGECPLAERIHQAKEARKKIILQKKNAILFTNLILHFLLICTEVHEALKQLLQKSAKCYPEPALASGQDEKRNPVPRNPLR